MSNDDIDRPNGRDDHDDASANDLDRAEILARRKRFVAAALSTLSLGAALVDCLPTTCLSPPRPQDAQSDGSDGSPDDAGESDASMDGGSDE